MGREVGEKNRNREGGQDKIVKILKRSKQTSAVQSIFIHLFCILPLYTTILGFKSINKHVIGVKTLSFHSLLVEFLCAVPHLQRFKDNLTIDRQEVSQLVQAWSLVTKRSGVD